jgi:hypothetical protein
MFQARSAQHAEQLLLLASAGAIAQTHGMTIGSWLYGKRCQRSSLL